MKHKHAELIKLWADGAEIEMLIDVEEWIPCSPSWSPHLTYRIKPEPKPDVECKYFVFEDGKVMWCENAKANLRLTFDSETNKLKDAEVLK